MNNQTDTQNTYPPLPEPVELVNGEACAFTEAQMYAYVDADRTLRAGQSEPVARHVTDEMVSRFLWWRLPDTFSPDCGITFKKGHPFGPGKYEPVGTNLFTAVEARAMLEHVLGGAGQSPTVPTTEQVLMDWLSDADSRIASLEQHIRNVLEIADTWKPDYATVMDLKTLRLAREALAYETARAALRSTLPQTTGDRS